MINLRPNKLVVRDQESQNVNHMQRDSLEIECVASFRLRSLTESLKASLPYDNRHTHC